MKNPPHRHKDVNVFKFKSFNDIVSTIDIRRNALYHIQDEHSAEQENNETCFRQSYVKWTVDNLSEEYRAIQKQIGGIVTLEQLLNSKDFVTEILLEGLKKASTLSLEPLLDLVVSTAKDLRQEFYPFFPQFLSTIIGLLNSKDPEQVEWTFYCVANLFKVLKPFLKKDLSVVYREILPLLNPRRYPEYVNNYAAECFSYIARDIRDKEKFLAMLLDGLKSHVDGLTGCGRLLYEIVKGVNHGMHTCAEEFLINWIKSLTNCSLHKEMLYEILTNFTNHLLQNTYPHNLEIFWKVSLDILSELCESAVEHDAAIRKILALLGQAVKYRNGKCICRLNHLIERLLILADSEISNETMLSVSQIVAIILLSSNLTITQLDSSRMSKKILGTSHKDIFEDFVWSLINWSQFEIIILPEFLKYFESHFEHEISAFELMTKIILEKAPLCQDGISLNNWKTYSINLKNEKTVSRIENFMGSVDESEQYVMCLILYPHIVGKDASGIARILENSVYRMLKDIPSYDTLSSTDLNCLKKKFYILSISIETIIHLDRETTMDINEVAPILLPYCNDDRFILTLRSLDQLLSIQPSEKLTFHLFQMVHSQLASNLSSHSHDIRRLTAHILQYFSKIQELRQHESAIYEIIYNCENITSTVQTYRDQLMNLQKLGATTKLFENIKATMYQLDPLRYLFGVLHINFNLLWKPVTNLLIEFSAELPSADFWSILRNQLNVTTSHIRNTVVEESSPKLDGTSAVLQDRFDQMWQNDERIDFVNYRILVWRMMAGCGQLIETKNREIVEMFLDFIDVEHNRQKDTGLWNLLSDTTIEMDAMADDDKSVNVKTKGKNKEKKIMSSSFRSFLPMMSVFTKLVNPKQVYREKDMGQLYMDLLCHSNPNVQKIALDCLMTYKHPYLVPYKEHLYGIIDEKMFKKTIISLKLNREDECIIVDEHRKDLMPTLMRILFSKLITKAPKGQGQERKSLILRTLGGCDEDEIFIVLNMAFRDFGKYLKDDPREMVKAISADIDLTSVISAKKMTSVLNFIDIIREEMAGSKSPQFLKYLLSITMSIGAIVQCVLDKSDKIRPSFKKLYKGIRVACLKTLTNIFTHFDKYPWQENEIEMVYQIFITPSLDKLPMESFQSPTQLLKLLHVFSKNTRYFALLTKLPQNTSDDQSPMKYIFDLLLNSQSRPIVCRTIMEMIENLLTLNDDQSNEEDVVPDIQVENSKCHDPTSKISYGSAIVLPYLPQILEKFQINLKKRRGLTKRDVHILSRCTELIRDSESCSMLLKLIMPILLRKSSSDDDESLKQMVITVSNLIEKVAEPERHIVDVAPMFQMMTTVEPRKLLCRLLTKISKRVNPNLQDDFVTMTRIVNELNAWNQKFIEQPDYDRRLEAYAEVERLQNEGKLNLNLGLLVIYHSFYYLRDHTMCDTASRNLQTMVPALVRQLENQKNDLDFLIGNVILNMIRRNLNNANENVSREGILLLGELARECPSAHPVLQDLNHLTNKQDREVDFFDNITHIQSHRHGKALLKFCSVAKTFDTPPNIRTLTQFILPLASQFICKEKYASKHGIVTSAIETIGAISRLLPWYHYEMLLKFYLKKMRFNAEYQKQLVRLVMEILNQFHFDLSKAKIAPQEMAKKLEEDAKEEIEDEPIKVGANEGEDKDEELVLVAANQEEDELTDKLLQSPEDEESEEIDKEINKSDEIACKKQKISIYQQQIVLNHKAAKRVVHIITTDLIPNLHRSITTMSTYESFHKVNKLKRRSEREEEEILRVPIALAMVKLLQKLPEGMLEHSLRGIFIKVCMFLKSPLKSVRLFTRNILKSIMQTVGTKYLGQLMNQMTSMLTRGFQVHVLTVTMFGILDVLKSSFKLGEIDAVLQSILSVCLEDIFGQTSDEKEVKRIAGHTPEAKPSSCSFQSLNIVAINISESCMLDLLMPLKNYLVKSQSKKVVTKVQNCCQTIAAGLVQNKHISLESLLMFIYGTSSESIPDLLPGAPRPVLTKSEKEKITRIRPDCFLIPEQPRGRSGAVTKVAVTNVRANAHVLIEFGLSMLQIILKRGKLLKINYEPFINPIVPVLLDSLNSSHILVTIYSLKCLSEMWNKSMEVQKLVELTPDIVQVIFKILHKYATPGMSTVNENFRLVKNSFGTIVSAIRNNPHFSITEDQLTTLLMYVDQNLADSSNQIFAFDMLKVILGRQLIVSQIHDIMRKISEMAITSESNNTRSEAKILLVNYLMNYPLGKKINGYFNFLVTNLNYETVSGREAAIQILNKIINRFPQEILHKKAAFMFVWLGTRLVNDESPDCRKCAATCIESLIGKCDETHQNQLFDVVLEMLQETKTTHIEMAAMLCSRFVAVEKTKFIKRIEQVLPLLTATLPLSQHNGPGKYVRLPNIDADDSDDMEVDENDVEFIKMEKERARDHQLIQVTNTILKIFENYQNKMADFNQYVDQLAYESQKLLAYEHVWVRINAAKILGLLLSQINVDRLKTNLLSDECDDNTSEYFNFLYKNPMSEIKSLVLDLCAQLIPDATDEDMANQVVNNLLYVANMIKDISLEKETKTENKIINLHWLFRRMRYVIHAEVATTPHITTLRTAIFHWMQGLIELLPERTLNVLSANLMAPLVREMSEEDKNIDAKLRQLALKVGNSLKQKIGDAEYQLLKTRLLTKLVMKRAERRKIVAQTKVDDPVRASLRKLGERNRKKAAKKRKMDVLKGRAIPKKKKRKATVDDDFF